MIHNKYFEILNRFTGDYQLSIYGRELVGKLPLSQKGIALALKELEHDSILKSTKKGNLRLYSLNLENPQIKEMIVITELTKKTRFFNQHKKIEHIFKTDDRVIGIFGSYAKDTQKKDSDIDLFVIGKKRNDDYDKLGKTYDLDISIKYFNEDNFQELLQRKNMLIKEIVQHHILIFSVEKFINLLWRDFYGFD